MWLKAAAARRPSVSGRRPSQPLYRPRKTYPFDSHSDSRRIGPMTEFIKPSVQAFLVCDQVIEDSITKKKSLIGLFTHLQALSFPFQHQQMGLYFCLTDAEGTYRFDIDLMYLNNEQLVCRATLPNIVIMDRLQISDFGINIPSLIFPAPGRYEFRLRMEGHLIAQKDFNVTPTRMSDTSVTEPPA